MSGFLAALVAAYVGLVSLMWIGQRQLMYHPDPSRPDPAAGGVPDMAAVEVETADGLVLGGWFRDAQAGRPTIVYFHGNAGHVGSRGHKVRPFLEAGYGVFLVGYRGYGGNPGRPTEDGLYADGRAALAFLRARGVAEGRWVLYGESLGSGVAVHLAAEMAGEGHPVGAVVLEAPFTSMADAAAVHYPWVPVRWLVRDRYESWRKIAFVVAPVLVLHGVLDATVPIGLGRALFAAARPPKEAAWFPDAAHNDLHDHGAAARVLAFIGQRVAARWPAHSGGTEGRKAR